MVSSNYPCRFLLVTTTSSYTLSRYRAAAPGEWDGVVRVSTGAHYSTGVLLFDGLAVLTAAHLFSLGETSANVQFETSAGTTSVSAGQVLLHPQYNAEDASHDLALVWLSTPAPRTAPRYNLYRDSDEIGQDFDLVGYGHPGTGSTGQDASAVGTRLHARNTFDADVSELKSVLGDTMGWTPDAQTQLLADFDDGNAAHDAFGLLMQRHDLGLGLDEGLIAPGDSGGPAFLNGLLAGIASYTSSLSYGSAAPDIDTSTNSSFGEVAAWQRMSSHQQWIDQSLRAHASQAPAQPSDVRKQLTEGQTGTTPAYFLVQFTGVRMFDQQKLSVQYQTRDGTATAGQDYLPVSGKLVLYPGETRATISVEILGDFLPEPDETFYLDIFNPVGGSFGDGVVKLTAMRTIVDDDGWWG